MARLTTWVSDKLHDVLGFSDKHTVEYLIGLARTSTSPESLVQRVAEGLNVDDKMASFASELWSKLPHKTQPAEHPYRARERALIEQREKFMGYALVSDGDDDDEEQLIKARESKKDRKRKHLRRKTESSSSDEDSPAGDTGSKVIDNESDSDEWEKEEKLRKKDLEDRDAFADRLKQRDKDKTRNILERSDKKVLECSV